MIQGIVFDLDDSLIPFMSLKRSCVDAAVDAMIHTGLTIPKVKAVERIYQIYYKDGLESQEIFDKFMVQELGGIDYKMLAAAVIAYKKTRARITPYPGVPPTLAELLRMGIKLAILSDAPKLQAWTRLTEAHLQDYFEHVVTFEDTNKRKPHPDPFKLVIQKLGTAPGDTLMVGDWASRDMLGGRSAGMVTAYVQYNDSAMQTPDQELEDIVDYKLASFRDITSIVKTHGVIQKAQV